MTWNRETKSPKGTFRFRHFKEALRRRHGGFGIGGGIVCVVVNPVCFYYVFSICGIPFATIERA
jgi:prolipoprotein diacylglyceryltransferase